jgi:hypothetical protein
MVDLFSAKMQLAEPSTIQHFQALVEFVEIWNRWLDQSLPPEVLGQLRHSEETLNAFYEDVADNFVRMQHALCGGRLRWARPVALKGPALAANPFAAKTASDKHQDNG